MKSSTKELIFETFMFLAIPFWSVVGMVLFSFLLPIIVVCIIIKYAIKLFSPNSTSRVDKLLIKCIRVIFDFFCNLKDYTVEIFFTCLEWLEKALIIFLMIVGTLGFIYINLKNCTGSVNYYGEHFDDSHRPGKF